MNNNDREKLIDQERQNNPSGQLKDSAQNANTSGIFSGMSTQFLGILLLILIVIALIGYLLLN